MRKKENNRFYDEDFYDEDYYDDDYRGSSNDEEDYATKWGFSYDDEQLYPEWND